MINFESQDFQKRPFPERQIEQFIKSALHDLKIAEESIIPDVVFKFCYDALIKLGIALIAKKGYKTRSKTGHHVKILEKLSQILGEEDILLLGNKMRQERNSNLYDGGFFVAEKDSREYLDFARSLFNKADIKQDVQLATAAILTGGKSSRMKQDKSLIKMEGRTLLERSISAIEGIFDEILVVGRCKEENLPGKARAVSDIFSPGSSLVGIHSAVKNASHEKCFVFACDMPFLNVDLIRFMIAASLGHDIVVPSFNGRLQPLHAIYSKSCIDPIETRLKEQNHKIIMFFEKMKVRVVTESECRKFDPEGKAFFNINTIEDYRKVSACLT